MTEFSFDKAEPFRLCRELAEYRKQQGITQRELAQRTGLQRNQVCRIEQGYYSVGMDIFASLAAALGKRIVFEDK